MSAPDTTSDNATPTAAFDIALVHYPIKNKRGDIVTTAITNIDLHDLGRLAAAYDVGRVFIVTPVAGQQELFERIAKHWRQGWGAGYNESRRRAFERLALAADLPEAIEASTRMHGAPPVTVATSAQSDGAPVLTFETFRTRLSTATVPHMLVLGTGWGMPPELLAKLDLRLEPVVARSDYRHLSVRSAAAIMLDRLLGPR